MQVTTDGPSDFSREVGRRLSEVRADQGLSQKQFAATLEVPIASYQRYEQGVRELPLSLALRLLKDCGVNPAWLLGGAEFGAPKFLGRDELSALLEDLFAAWIQPITASGVPVSFAEMAAGWRIVMRAGLQSSEIPKSEIQYLHKRLFE